MNIPKKVEQGKLFKNLIVDSATYQYCSFILDIYLSHLGAVRPSPIGFYKDAATKVFAKYVPEFADNGFQNAVVRFVVHQKLENYRLDRDSGETAFDFKSKQFVSEDGKALIRGKLQGLDIEKLLAFSMEFHSAYIGGFKRYSNKDEFITWFCGLVDAQRKLVDSKSQIYSLCTNLLVKPDLCGKLTSTQMKQVDGQLDLLGKAERTLKLVELTLKTKRGDKEPLVDRSIKRYMDVWISSIGSWRVYADIVEMIAAAEKAKQ